MNVKKLIGAAVTAAFLSTAAVNASADVITSNAFLGASFNNLTVGTIHIGSISNLVGSFWAANSIELAPGYSVSLSSVTFSSGSVGALVDTDGSITGFSFSNVAVGDYLVKASGTLNGDGQLNGLQVISASYNITPVPEPESYAMLLAGLGLMGTIARRRTKSKAV